MALTNEEILEAIASKTVLEISELIKMMEEKFGVSAAAAAVETAAAPINTTAPATITNPPRPLALPPLLKKRRNSTSFSNPPVPTRSPSSRSFAK